MCTGLVGSDLEIPIPAAFPPTRVGTHLKKIQHTEPCYATRGAIISWVLQTSAARGPDLKAKRSHPGSLPQVAVDPAKVFFPLFGAFSSETPKIKFQPKRWKV